MQQGRLSSGFAESPLGYLAKRICNRVICARQKLGSKEESEPEEDSYKLCLQLILLCTKRQRNN